MNKRFRIVQTNTWTGSRKLENLCRETLNTRILGFFVTFLLRGAKVVVFVLLTNVSSFFFHIIPTGKCDY